LGGGRCQVPNSPQRQDAKTKRYRGLLATTVLLASAPERGSETV
jgi:hypothetical protein